MAEDRGTPKTQRRIFSWKKNSHNPKQTLSLSLSSIVNLFFFFFSFLSLFFPLVIEFSSMNNINNNRSQDQRSRPAKAATIHGCALSGDLVGLQRLLRDNPSLLNERNPVVRSPISTNWASPKCSLFFFPYEKLRKIRSLWCCEWKSLLLLMG